MSQAESVPAKPARKKLLIVRFPGDGTERQECVDWLLNTVYGFKDSPDVEILRPQRINDTPAPMIRNMAVQIAQDNKADYLLMVDNDMGPDYLVGKDPRAKPFLPTALKWMKEYGEPCAIAAPYCGPPPEESVYVFDWVWRTAPAQNFNANLQMVNRDEAAHRTGIWPAAALPTGLMLFDMRVFDILPHPYFYYERTDNRWIRKASTEDVTISRDMMLCRIMCFCAWDCWAEHVKSYRVGKPNRESVDIVNERIRAIVARGRTADEKIEHSAPGSADWPDGLPLRSDSRASHLLMPLELGSSMEYLPACGVYARKKDGDGQEEGQSQADRRTGGAAEGSQAPATA